MQQAMDEELKIGKFKTLDILHHFTSGLKAIFTTMAYQGIDNVRSNCGGAGYSNHSYLPQIFSEYSPTITYEGDNTVMAQQNISFIEHTLKKI
jgi:acyl-CoA oxidase